MQEEALSPDEAATPTDGLPVVLETVVALYSFASQNEEELSFTKGEQLEVVEKPENDPDWWKARNQSGDTGLVPKNYVQVRLLPSGVPQGPLRKCCETTRCLALKKK